MGKSLFYTLKELSYTAANRRPINPYWLDISYSPDPGIAQLIDSLEAVIRDKSKLRR